MPADEHDAFLGLGQVGGRRPVDVAPPQRAADAQLGLAAADELAQSTVGTVGALGPLGAVSALSAVGSLGWLRRAVPGRLVARCARHAVSRPGRGRSPAAPTTGRARRRRPARLIRRAGPVRGAGLVHQLSPRMSMSVRADCPPSSMAIASAVGTSRSSSSRAGTAAEPLSTASGRAAAA